MVGSFYRSRKYLSWNLNESQTKRLNVVYLNMLRTMVKGGHKRRDQNNDLGRDDRDFRYILTNQRILELCNTDDISTFVRKQ